MARRASSTTSEKAKKTKVCTRCGKRFKVAEFFKDKHQKDGLSSWHKGCEREYAKAYRLRKKAEVKA